MAVSKSLYYVDIFFSLKIFYPPKGDTQYLTRGPFVFTYVLSPEGRYVVYPVGVQLRSLSIY